MGIVWASAWRGQCVAWPVRAAGAGKVFSVGSRLAL